MTPTQKIIGTSLFSLLLVIVGLFLVCSGRVPQVQTEEDPLSEETSDEAYKQDLLNRLEILEGSGETSGNPETAEAAPEPQATTGTGEEATLASSESQSGERAQKENAESFLTPELFQGMNAEITQLENAVSSRDRTIDSLRAEMQETNYQVAALETTVKTKQMNTKLLSGGAHDAAIYNSDYGLAYQDALDDFYVRRYDSAIRKFRAMLLSDDKHPLADNCQYWLGECYFATGNYYQSIAEFQKVYVFENSNKANDAQLMIGIAFMKAGEKDLARVELNVLVSFDPQSASAKKAQRYLRMLERV